MKFFQKLLNKFNGQHYPQEYLCLDGGIFEQPLHVYLLDNNRVLKDITYFHAFVGYCPLVFALPLSVSGSSAETIQLAFSQKTFSTNEILAAKDAIARLWLKKINEQQAFGETILYYQGTKGEHRFSSSFQQFILQLHNRLYHKKPGNVFLAGNLYKQVQIAYTIPRNISLITVGQDGLFNLFPTDLHGPAGDSNYIISLRHEGKACRQVMDAGKLLLTQVENQFYKTAYSLGKNHMQPLKNAAFFPFGSLASGLFGLPVPSAAVSYRELELQDSFTQGIHRIMLFKLLHREQLSENGIPLAHIHNAYASWRYKNGLPGNYLLR